jgi:uncharacterized protein YdeI (YjbR/CyaY-like superfamily)
VQRLIAKGKMMPAGSFSIKTAQQNGSWTLLDDVETLQLPADLEQAFVLHPEARTYFMHLCPSAKRHALLRLVSAKRPATRQQRILSILALGAH